MFVWVQLAVRRAARRSDVARCGGDATSYAFDAFARACVQQYRSVWMLLQSWCKRVRRRHLTVLRNSLTNAVRDRQMKPQLVLHDCSAVDNLACRNTLVSSAARRVARLEDTNEGLRTV